MHSALNRVQNVFGFFTTVATVLAGVIAVLSLLTRPSPNIPAGALQLHNVQVVKGRPHYYSRKTEEYAHIRFDLDLDIDDLFGWNTKQVFLYITASYPSSANTTSRQIIWDAVLPHPLSPSHHNQYGATRRAAKKFEFSGGSKAKKSASASSKAKKEDKKRPPPGLLKLDAQKPKYMVTDVSGRLAEREGVVLELNWNVQPWVGALTWGAAAVAGGMPWDTWKGVQGHSATDVFGMPALKDKKAAEEAAGKDGLATEKGAEAHRLMAG